MIKKLLKLPREATLNANCGEEAQFEFEQSESPQPSVSWK